MTAPKNGSKQTSKVTPQKLVSTKTVNTAKGVASNKAQAAAQQGPETPSAVSIYTHPMPESEIATLLRDLEIAESNFRSEIAQMEYDLQPVLPMGVPSVTGLILAEGDRVGNQSPLGINLYQLLSSLQNSVHQLRVLRSQLCI